MLVVKNFSIDTRVNTLKNFNYEFLPNNIYGIVAENGAGKTTFFRALTGLVYKSSGIIMLNDKELEKNKKDLFYFEVSEWLNDDMSGRDYLLFIQKNWNSQQSIIDVIKYWNMDEYIDLPIKKLSLGMKQKLLISMYVISNASCLIFDEITNGLDEQSRILLFNLLKKMAKEEGKLIILSSHYSEDVTKECDYILRLTNGCMEVSKNEFL